jgi:hydrogenase expression/formation protein HypD
MKCAEEFRSRKLTESLLQALPANRDKDNKIRIMEVCGTHTNAIFRHGIRSLLPRGIELISGPGCPVCVTPAGHVDAFIAAAGFDRVIVATFGDLIRVPGSRGSLARAREAGARVEIVYSPMDALQLARQEPEQMVVFPAVGFETTAPTIAATVLEAERLGLDNFSIIAACKIMPPPLELLLSDSELRIDGLLCPGHVSAIIGAAAYKPLAKKYHISCAVSGFEPADIVSGLLALASQIREGRARVDNCYSRVVTDSGNHQARELCSRVFKIVDTEWRGLGVIAGSGLGLRDKYRKFDALARLDLKVESAPEPKGCKCGDILKGRLLPPACPLYGKQCTPLQPVGPCMVSSEGTCAAFYRYWNKR